LSSFPFNFSTSRRRLFGLAAVFASQESAVASPTLEQASRETPRSPLGSVGRAISVDIDALGATVAENSISPHLINSAGSVSSMSHWGEDTKRAKKYFKVDASNAPYVLQTIDSARDMEIATSAARATLYVKLTETGNCIWLSGTPTADAGSGFTLGMASNVPATVEGSLGFGDGLSYQLATIPFTSIGWNGKMTEDVYWSLGCAGMMIYVKFKGKIIFKMYDWRHLLWGDGRAAIRTANGYGIRSTTFTIYEPFALFSDPSKRIIDMRDFPMWKSENRAKGSISEGSSELTLDVPATAGAYQFAVGDFICVPTGYEVGKGTKGTVGVGGAYPTLSFATRADLDLIRPPAPVIAWVKDTGAIWAWTGKIWNQFDPEDKTCYYTNRAIPFPFHSRITKISDDGLVLTLSDAASASTMNAPVFIDMGPVFSYVVGGGVVGDSHGGAPFNYGNQQGITICIPAGEFCLATGLMLSNFSKTHSSWTITGAGRDVTKLFTPNRSAGGITVREVNNCVVKDLTIQGTFNDGAFPITGTSFYLSKENPFGSDGSGNYTRHGGPASLDQSKPWQTAPFTIAITIQRSEFAEVRDVIVNDYCRSIIFQQCGYSWMRRVTAKASAYYREYMQWLLMHDQCNCSGIEDATVICTYLTPGYNSFNSFGTKVVRVTQKNALMAMNTSNAFLIDGVYLEFSPKCNEMPDGGGVAVHRQNPALNINTNAPNSATDVGGVVRDIIIRVLGYMDAANTLIGGITVNANNACIEIRGGRYVSPSNSIGAHVTAIAATSANLIIDSFIVLCGDVPRSVFPQPITINPSNPTTILSNCISPGYTISSKNVSIVNCVGYVQGNDFSVGLNQATGVFSVYALQTKGITVSKLPLASVAGVGARSFVTDSTKTLTGGVGALVAGGGTNAVPVYSDGLSWKIG
jgi:hypothetical protein